MIIIVSCGKVSIIIPVYNCLNYLPKCLESVINQTYSDMEVILVDDGSTDGSSLICDEYAERYSFIQTIHQENTGPGMARNAGLDVIKGDFLTYIDADDYVAEKYVEVLVNLLQKYHADIAEVGIVWMYPTRNYFENSDENIIEFSGSDVLIKDYFSKERQIRNCTAGRMYNMEKFKNIRFSEKSIGEDSEYSLKMLSKCECLVKYHKCLYCCRAYQESLTRKPMNHKNFDIVEIAFRDAFFVEKSGVKLNDWEYIFQRFIQMCYGLLEMLAVQKKEKYFSEEMDNMILIYEKMNELAKKHSIELSEKLSQDIKNIDVWARNYRKKNRKKIILGKCKSIISKSVGNFKVKIMYEYKFEKV